MQEEDIYMGKTEGRKVERKGVQVKRRSLGRKTGGKVDEDERNEPWTRNMGRRRRNVYIQSNVVGENSQMCLRSANAGV
jgi:hypothetical protein